MQTKSTSGKLRGLVVFFGAGTFWIHVLCCGVLIETEMKKYCYCLDFIGLWRNCPEALIIAEWFTSDTFKKQTAAAICKKEQRWITCKQKKSIMAFFQPADRQVKQYVGEG